MAKFIDFNVNKIKIYYILWKKERSNPCVPFLRKGHSIKINVINKFIFKTLRKF